MRTRTPSFAVLSLAAALTVMAPLAAPVAAQPAPASAGPYTLEQVMSYAFPTGLVAAPQGQRIAWLANERGQRNVWVAEAPRWEPRRVTAYDADDGRDLSGLQWLPDGQRLIFLRGHGTNMDGVVANPTSDIDGGSRDLWLADVRGGQPVRLAGAVNAAVAPSGARLAWIAGRDVMLLDLDRAATGDAVMGNGPAGVDVSPYHFRRLFTVRSAVNDLQWSPDGSRIAFVSPRDGRAIIGVFDITADRITWLTNSVDRDATPRWSPDGSRIAFIRYLTGEPGFSVWSVDAAQAVTPDEHARQLWRSPTRPLVAGGSVAYPRAITGSYDVMYGRGHIVVPGEWSGFQRLYAIPENGGEARELTPGERGIVENASLSPDREWVWISANTQSIDYRQLGRVRLRDGHPEWVEQGDVAAWGAAPFPDGRGIAYIRADHAEHASVYRRDLAAASASAGGAGDAMRITGLNPQFPLAGMVKPEQVIYTTEDGWDIHAQLFLPPGLRPGERVPGVLFLHGGSRRQMLLAWHYGDYYHHTYAFNQYLASQGYAVLSVNFRSGIGYGTAFRNAPDYGRSGASEYQDVIDGARWLQQHPAVDPDRIGLWGGSYGGYLTALGLARNSDVFRAGVDIHGVHDWNEQTGWYGRRDTPAATTPQQQRARDVAFAASPVADMATWTSPVLIIHGDDDRNVPFEASIDLVRRLRQKGDVHFEELYFVDDVHGFLRHANWLETFRRSADFFHRHLKAAPPAR
jgi:dipeptidyl aminopeptidase/acylaminoacyl peptidase